MDMTIVSMQKLARLRAFIQDSPLSSNDAFVSHPLAVVQSPSPVKELAPQDIRISRSWTSPIQSVHSTSEEPPLRASVLFPRPLRRALSRSSSLIPSLMGSKGKRKAEKGGVSAREEGRASAGSSTGLGNVTGPSLKTVWSEHDPYLPRAKPPPSLKRIKHARNRSENDVSPPDLTVPSRPSNARCSSSGQSSGPYSTVSCSSRRSLDAPSIEISNVSNLPAADVQHTLTRIGTRTTIASGASEGSDAIFTPSSPNWQPPTNWTGPSKAVSVDKDQRPGLGRWFSRKKGAQSSSKGSSMQAPARLNRIRLVKKMMPDQLADAGEPEEQEASVIRGVPLSSDVLVKIQCYEGDGWHEKPMADIIPKLRELRFK